MAFDTLDRSPPAFFRQGPSAAARLVFFAALSLLLMAMDVRWHVAAPVRNAISLALTPLANLARAPSEGLAAVGEHFASVQSLQHELAAQRQRNVELALQAQRAVHLSQDNTDLRRLLQLREQAPVPSLGAQIVAQARDPFSRKLYLDKGAGDGVQSGSPVIDAQGLLGQVTLAGHLQSQVTLITDRDSSVPVEVVRDRQRGVLVGTAGTTPGSLQMLWQANDTDVRAGDLVVTSGLDGVYPAGLVVAHVTRVQRDPDSTFARVWCAPVARVDGGRYVLVLRPRAPLAPAPAESAGRHPPHGRGKR